MDPSPPSEPVNETVQRLKRGRSYAECDVNWFFNVIISFRVFQFHCCGIDGPNDWIVRNVAALPHSCCRNDGGQGTTCTTTEAWQVGCLHKSIDLVKGKSELLFKIVVGIAAGEVSVNNVIYLQLGLASYCTKNPLCCYRGEIKIPINPL